MCRFLVCGLTSVTRPPGRLSPSGGRRVSDNNALLMLRCVASAFRALLRPAESAAAGDGEPSEPLTALMASKPVESVSEIDKVLAHLKEREPSSADAASLAQLQHLAQWVTDLCLQSIAALTDGRHKQVRAGLTGWDGAALTGRSKHKQVRAELIGWAGVVPTEIGPCRN